MPDQNFPMHEGVEFQASAPYSTLISAAHKYCSSAALLRVLSATAWAWSVDLWSPPLLEQQDCGRRRTCCGDLADSVETGDVLAWLQTLEIIYDAHGLSMEERLLYTIPLLAESVLRTAECLHPVSYAQLCCMLTQRFSVETNPSHILHASVGLSQLQGELEAYLDAFWL